MFLYKKIKKGKFLNKRMQIFSTYNVANIMIDDKANLEKINIIKN